MIYPSSRRRPGSSEEMLQRICLYWTPGWLAPLLRGHRSDRGNVYSFTLNKYGRRFPLVPVPPPLSLRLRKMNNDTGSHTDQMIAAFFRLPNIRSFTPEDVSTSNSFPVIISYRRMYREESSTIR